MPLNRFQDIKALILNSDFITSDRFLNHTKGCFKCDYSKRDFLYHSGYWRGERVTSKYLQSRQPTKFTLLIGHSDTATSFKNVFPFFLKGYKKIWAVNARASNSILNPLPLGLTNQSNESPIHGLLGDVSHFAVADQESAYPTKFNGNIYGNFSLGTNGSIRKPLAALLHENGSRFEEPDFTPGGRIKYLKSLRDHELTVCPEGNGIDTHRLWETLYMGGTPLISKSNSMSPLVENLPVIVLNDWSELSDLDTLERKWYELSNQHFNFAKLSAKFWMDIFCNQES